MKTIVIPKLQVAGEIAVALAKLANALDGTDPAAHSTALVVATRELRATFDDDEIAELVRLIKEARVQCRICEKRHRYSRTDRGLCRECARQALAEGEAQ